MAKKEAAAENLTDPSQAILQKAKDWPEWQRDALRRIAEQTTLRDADRADMLNAIKTQNGLPCTPPPAPKPLGPEHLANTAANQPRLVIESLTDAQNVNLLKPGEKLDFIPEGITLIYGANGSGKSGYTRIFKKACAARKAEDILANVFDPDYDKKPAATAKFHIAEKTAAAENKEVVTWAANAECPAKLRQVRVFDRKAAGIYVQESANLAYVPYNLDVLDKLAEACDKLKVALQAEATAADTEFKTLSGSVPNKGNAQTIASTITATTTQASIDAQAQWAPADETKLAEVTELLESPTKAISDVRVKKTRRDSLLGRITRIETALSQAKVDDLAARHQAVIDTKAAAAATSKTSFSSDPDLLPGVGSTTWRALWAAARAFSISEAYPGNDFPVITESGGKEPRCLLCHQPLSEDACDRQKRFEEFVRGDVANKAVQAETKLTEAVRAVEAVSLVLAADDDALLSELQVDAPEITTKIRTFFADAAKRKTAIVSAQAQGSFAGLAAEPAPCSSDLKTHIEGLDAKIKELEGSLTPERKAALKLEQTALLTRKTLSEQKAALTKLIENRLLRKKLEDCIKDVGTRAITEAKKKLNQLFVNERFNETLTEELAAVGVTRKVTLDFPIKSGLAYQRAIFGDSAFPNLDLVLSEGEHRAVAIACFLAEARMLGEHQPLVVDDPVSSLDHMRRERVTRRLVAEAKKRQIIIFTHDMVFWADVARVAQEEHVPVLVRDIRPEGGLCGKVGEGDTPWTILGVAARLQYLEGKRLPELRALDEHSQDYADRSRDVGEKLRETWERLIEECVLQGTVVRLRPSVQSQQLDMVQVSDEDWEKVYHGMTRTSGWSHDLARAAGTPPPKVDELKKEIDEIRALAGKLKKDGDQLRATRKKRLKDPSIPGVVGVVTAVVPAEDATAPVNGAAEAAR